MGYGEHLKMQAARGWRETGSQGDHIPAGHTPAGVVSGTGVGDLVIGYHDSDAVRSLTQDGTTTTYDLDVGGRREVATTGPTGGQPTRTVTRHYTDTSDNPGWVQETTGGATTITRYLEALAGNLTVEVTDQGQVTLPVADLHGDVNTTITVPADSQEPATGINGWADTEEYGNPYPASPGAGNVDVTGVLGYGWLGAHQRATDSTGLLLMGARLYNPLTGQFTA